MLTIRPPPARIAMNASRQQRNEPVRFTPSVCPQISEVVSVNGADVRTPAAQTRAASGPFVATSAKTRLTSRSSLTSAAAAVASPPLSRIEAASDSSVRSSRATSTTRAPAPASASAVAAPIPRLAPVTSAIRPARQWGRSGTACGPGTSPRDSLVQRFRGIDRRSEVELALGVHGALRGREPGGPPYRLGCRPDVARLDEEARHLVDHHLRERAAPKRHHRGAARLRLGGDHPERLIPAGGTQHDRCTRHRLPELRSRNARAYQHIPIAAPRIDPLAGVAVVVAVAEQLERDTRRAGDLDRLGGAFLGAEPACKDRPLAGEGRERDVARRHQRRQDRIDLDKPAPRLCLMPGDAGPAPPPSPHSTPPDPLAHPRPRPHADRA